MPRKTFRAGFITLIGRPSTGKSTFLNEVLDQKVSIVSPYPQSTRNLIRGIHNLENGQLVFVDTPGFHLSNKRFNKRLTSLLYHALDSVDLQLYFVDATRKLGTEDEQIQKLIEGNNTPSIVIINKCDIAPPEKIINLQKYFKEKDWVKEIFAISALTHGGIPNLLSHIENALPIHPPYYPDTVYTDQHPSLRITEIIRHTCWENFKQEIPYALYVEIEKSLVHKDDNNEITSVDLDVIIYVDSKSHIPIVVGKKGSQIKKLRESSSKILKNVFPYPIELHLQCKQKPKWRTNSAVLNKTIY